MFPNGIEREQVGFGNGTKPDSHMDGRAALDGFINQTWSESGRIGRIGSARGGPSGPALPSSAISATSVLNGLG